MIETAPDRHLPIVVFAHVHYPEIWAEMCVTIEERLNIPFHLVITRSRTDQEIAIPRTPFCQTVRFVDVLNKGRDILPFLHALSADSGFEVGLKLHTKKSPQREDGAAWRSQILDSLLPPGDRLPWLVERFQADQRIGLVAPDQFCLAVKPWVLTNEAGMVSIMSELGTALAEYDLDDAYFAAGSMFWFRREALSALTKSTVIDLFQPEAGQLDGTIAHAMERVFPVAARRQGYVSLSVTALANSTPDMPLETLLNVAKEHADIPNRFFPGPNIPALAAQLTDNVPRDRKARKLRLRRRV